MDKLNLVFDPKEIELKIRQMINGLYGADFCRNIVVQFDGDFYYLRLHVHDNLWCPLEISMQTTDEEKFLKFICEELDKRQLYQTGYLRIELEDGNK